MASPGGMWDWKLVRRVGRPLPQREKSWREPEMGHLHYTLPFSSDSASCEALGKVPNFSEAAVFHLPNYLLYRAKQNIYKAPGT